MEPEIHYRTHKRPPPVPIRRQTYPVPTTPSSRSILILSSHLRLGLPNILLPSGFPTKTLCTPLPVYSEKNVLQGYSDLRKCNEAEQKVSVALQCALDIAVRIKLNYIWKKILML